MWSWGYTVLFSRFILLVLDSGIAKSFGVLIPLMVQRLNSNYTTVGLICSMPATLVSFFFPIVTLMLQKFSGRSIAMAGGALSGSCIVACGFITDIAVVGICLALSGVGISMAMVPLIMAMNDFFPGKFVFVNTITLYGFTAGSMLLPVITEMSVVGYGYSGAFVILGGMAFNIVVCGATIREPPRNVALAQDEENHEHECLITTGTSTHHGEMDDLKVDDNFEVKDLAQNQTQTNDTSLPTHMTHKTLHAANSVPSTRAPSSGILQEPLFLCSLPVNSLLFFVTYAWMLFLVPHAEHLGIPGSRAVFLSTIGGIGGVIGRTFFAILVGKGADVFVIYIIAGVICTLSFLMDFLSSAYEVRAVLSFLQGFCLFIEDTSPSALCKEMVFDDKNFEMANGLVGFFIGLGGACSGVLSGYLFDITQSFTKVFIVIGFIHALMVVNLIVVTIASKKGNSTSLHPMG